MKKLLLLILFPLVIKAQKTVDTLSYSDSQKRIESYRTRVINGESMRTLATLYSEDPGSAVGGGVIKNVSRGVMVPEFEEIAFSLKPGEVSHVFKTEYGFHFIQLIAVKGDKIDLCHILIKP